jgi:hypothetical protein
MDKSRVALIYYFDRSHCSVDAEFNNICYRIGGHSKEHLAWAAIAWWGFEKSEIIFSWLGIALADNEYRL